MKPRTVFSILIGLWVGVLSGCRPDNRTTEGVPGTDSTEDLIAQRERILRQLDSLSKLLRTIDEQMARENPSDLPFISALTVTPTRFDQYIEIQGSVKTDGNVALAAEMGGKVAAIFHAEGDHVKQGATILQLDDAVIRQQLAQARAQYQLAKTTYFRQQRLYKEGVIPEIEYLQSRTRKKALEKQIAALQAQLKKMTVKAPIAGKLDALDVRKGEVVAPLRPIGRIINLRDVYLESDLSERYLPLIKKGDRAAVHFPVFDTTLTGRVQYVGSFIHPTNRTFKVHIALDNATGLLRPNLTGVLRIHTYHADSAVVVPLDVIQEDRAGHPFVYVLDSTATPNVYKIRRQRVKLGRSYKNKVMVESGLQPGDRIATGATRGLTEGQLVRLSPSTPRP